MKGRSDEGKPAHPPSKATGEEKNPRPWSLYNTFKKAIFGLPFHFWQAVQRGTG